MMNKEVLTEFSTRFNDLLLHLRSFNQDEIDIVPFQDSWTAGHVIEHILKSASSLSKLLLGKVAATERDPSEKVRQIREIFLNYSVKLQSPDFIQPIQPVHQKDKLVKDVETTMQEIEAVIKTEDLSFTCLDFELPKLGLLTRLEWIWFVTYHTQRHTHQLKMIHQSLHAAQLKEENR